MSPLQVVALALFCAAPAESPQINPAGREILSHTLVQWDFDRDSDDWSAEHECSLAAEGGLLRISITGNDPYVDHGLSLPGGDLVVEFKARAANAGSGAVYWTTSESPGRGEDKSRHFPLQHDGQ